MSRDHSTSAPTGVGMVDQLPRLPGSVRRAGRQRPHEGEPDTPVDVPSPMRTPVFYPSDPGHDWVTIADNVTPTHTLIHTHGPPAFLGAGGSPFGHSTPGTVKPIAAPRITDDGPPALCRSGESLHVIDVRHGRVTLTPCGRWTVHGNDQTWVYRCDLSGPDTTRTITREAASVVHVRYAAHPSRPWAGRSPVRLAVDTARVAGLLETATAGELNFTQQQVLTPRRNQGDYAPTDTLGPDTIQKIVSAFAEHVSTGAFVIPADVTAQRLGPEPPDSFALLRDRFENSILAMCGIPPALVAPRGTGTGARETFRQVLHALLKPLGALLAEELQTKLDPAAALSFDALRAGDITGTARAFGSLVTAGVTPKSAAAVVGLDDVEVREVSA